MVLPRTVQFERVGFFVVDRDSGTLPSIAPSADANVEIPKLVFNLTVPLKVTALSQTLLTLASCLISRGDCLISM